ncbi:MAG: class F sortase [Candidatus Pacebacteria bacterium]|nr:class F sortase [Candidatus Paceibacterota bacterium]
MKLVQKISNKKPRIVVISIAVLFLVFISYFAMQTSAKNSTIKSIEESVVTPVQIAQNKLLAEANTTKQVVLVSGTPVRIKIPSIKVNAIVENVGLTLDGAVDAPVGPDNTGWWNGGPIPGAIGNAIIDGHSGWRNNIPAAFDDLKNLKKGDKIYVTSSTGITSTFIVRELKIYDRNDEALDVFISSDGKSHLNLITCTGIWNVVEKGRESRVVVFSDLEI